MTRLSMVFFSVIALSASNCSNPPMPAVDATVAKKLAGSWSVVFFLSSSPVMSAGGGSRQPIEGRIALLANKSVTESYAGIPMVTAYGSYDIDFSPFGFPSPENGTPPTVVAASSVNNSVEIVLNPASETESIRLQGLIASDSIKGTWTVSFPRAGSGGGLFVMHRTP